MTQVAWQELLEAYDFANLGAEYEHRAFIDKATGRIYFASDEGMAEEDRPEDWEDTEHFLELPRAQDLDLGVYLVLDFVARHLPHDYGTVSNFFQQADAYRRFKNLVEKRGILDHWYQYEAEKTANALRSWCRQNGLETVQRTVRA